MQALACTMSLILHFTIFTEKQKTYFMAITMGLMTQET